MCLESFDILSWQHFDGVLILFRGEAGYNHSLLPSMGRGAALPAESVCACRQEITQQVLFGSPPPGPLCLGAGSSTGD